MSLILDALNRSRQDSEQVPGLASDHFVDAPVPTSSWIVWLIVAGLALAVLVIGLLLLGGLPQPTAPATAVVERQVSPEPAATPVSSEAVAPPVVSPPATPRAIPQAKPPVPQGETAVNSQRRQRLDVPASATPVVAPVDPSVAALYQQRDEPAVVQPRPTTAAVESATVAQGVPARSNQQAPALEQEEVIDIERLVKVAEEELANAKLPEHEVPLLAALSQQTKDSIPTLMYLRHDYSGNPANSRVVINGKTLKAGDSVTGIKVLEVLPDSVVLESRGNRFRLRALNSWVNL